MSEPQIVAYEGVPTNDGRLLLSGSIRLPENDVPVYSGIDHTEPRGRAFDFSREGNAIYCRIELEEGLYLEPKYTVDLIVGIDGEDGYDSEEDLFTFKDVSVAAVSSTDVSAWDKPVPRRVLKWRVNLSGGAQGLIGSGQVLHIAQQYPDDLALTVWTLEKEEGPVEPTRKVEIVGTGHPVPDKMVPLGSVIMLDGEYVWHLFGEPVL